MSNDENEVVPDEYESLKVVGEKVVKTLRHLYDHQGITPMDLLWVLQGAMSEVVSWGLLEEDDLNEALDDEEDDGIGPTDWSAEQDALDAEDDEDDIPDQGDPLSPL